MDDSVSEGVIVGRGATENSEIAVALRSHGLRVTRARSVTYETLRSLGGHRSVDEVFGSIASCGGGVSRMSVYNAMRDLATCGLVMLAGAGPGRALYEASGDRHHHFVCRECGVVVDVPCVSGAHPCIGGGEEVGMVEEAQVIYRGVCSACLESDSGTAGAGVEGS